MATRLLLVEEAVIFAMAGNPRFVAEFPFLSAAKNLVKTAKASCGVCSSSAQTRIKTVHAIKLAIRQLSPERKTKLKSMLNATQVKLRMRENKKIVDYTF